METSISWHPGGGLLFGQNLTNPDPLNQGIMTLSTGNISIFTDGNVTLGTSRIFTFRGGNEIIWSTNGNIAAGAASKTLQSAPPNRFLIDPETGASTLDVAGLATGGRHRRASDRVSERPPATST